MYEAVLGDPTADVTVLPSVLICRVISQGANIELTELEKPQAFSGTVNDSEVFSFQKVSLFDFTIMTPYNAVNLNRVRGYEVKRHVRIVFGSILLLKDRFRLCKVPRRYN